MSSERRAQLFVLLSIMFAVMRIAGVKDEIFQAFAHVWVGFLLCLIVYKLEGDLPRWLLGWLTVVEVVCFVYFKHFANATAGVEHLIVF